MSDLQKRLDQQQSQIQKAHQLQEQEDALLDNINQGMYGGKQALNNPMGAFAPQAQSQAGMTLPSTPQIDDDEPDKVISVKDTTVSEAKSILKRTLKTDIVPFLWGPPGVGKSSLVREVCQEENLQLLDVRLSLLNPVDLRGLPVINRTTKQADWYAPSFLPKEDEKTPGVLFLDEINLAPLTVQAAAYQLILDKRVGEYKFPKTWRIVAAGNREVDRANVYKISAPLANRFFHLTINPDFQTWAKWAQLPNGNSKPHIRKEILNFLILRPVLIMKMPSDSEKAFPSPRTWNFASDFLDVYQYREGHPMSGELKQILVGVIGEPVAKEFIIFLEKEELKEIPDKIRKFQETGEIKLPKKDVSVRFAIITAICNGHREGSISDERYKKFLGSLTEEEKEAIKKIEEEGI